MHETERDVIALRAKAVALATWHSTEAFKVLLEFQRIAVATLSLEEISERAD